MLEYVKLRLYYQVVSELVLPYYKGSTFRGMFRTSLKRICCFDPSQSCRQCSRTRDCAYTQVTEHTTEAGENTALPYALSCSQLNSNRYFEDEDIVFDFVLLGRALEYLPQIIAAFSSWDVFNAGGFQPLIRDEEVSKFLPSGNTRPALQPHGKIRLKKIDQVKSDGLQAVYRQGRPFIRPEPEDMFQFMSPSSGTWRVRLDMLSPLRIFRKIRVANKRIKKLIEPDELEFQLLFNSIRTRLYGLTTYFGSDERGILQKLSADAESEMDKVQMYTQGLRLEKVRRYRSKNNKSDPQDGLIGECILQDVSGSIMPWILAGGLLQIGKSTSLGYGEYKAVYGQQTRVV